MADNLDAVRDLFKRADVTLSRDDVWSVQGTPVVKHKALERLCAAIRIRFEAPKILRAERDEAVILATGTLNDVTEWSIGEACVNINYRVTGKMAAYVYAMAEKRARDRVILKLAGLQGVYSEDEADDFKRPVPEPEESAAPAPAQKRDEPTMTELLMISDKALSQAALKGTEELKTVWERLSPDLKPALKIRLEELKKRAAEFDAYAATHKGSITITSGKGVAASSWAAPR